MRSVCTDVAITVVMLTIVRADVGEAKEPGSGKDESLGYQEGERPRTKIVIAKYLSPRQRVLISLKM
jgi:hypothetical protein